MMTWKFDSILKTADDYISMGMYANIPAIFSVISHFISIVEQSRMSVLDPQLS